MSKLKLFVELMSYVHNDNERLSHFARSEHTDIERSTMPITAFIYEYFMYNALYSVDWISSKATKDIVYSSETKEKKKQDEFENYIKSLCSGNGQIFFQSFRLLTGQTYTGSWTRVVPDSRITTEIGRQYFNNMAKLQKCINESISNGNYDIENIFRLIGECRYYVYLVRCNVFHGSKNIGDIDEDHKRRINVYHSFLKCLMNGFFNITKNGNIFT